MAAYQKQELPVCAPSAEDLAWAVGFLEGEGSFCRMSGTDKRARIQAGQKHREPLEHLLRWFGGRIYELKAKPYFVWILRGEPARNLVPSLYSRLSTRRQAQCDRVLTGEFSVVHGSPERYTQRGDRKRRA